MEKAKIRSNHVDKLCLGTNVSDEEGFPNHYSSRSRGKRGYYPNLLGNPREEREKITTIHGELGRSAGGEDGWGEGSSGWRP
jgi:hypothetical protein